MPMNVKAGRGSRLSRETGRGGVAVKCFKLPILARAAVLAGHCSKPLEVEGSFMKPTVAALFGVDCTLMAVMFIELGGAPRLPPALGGGGPQPIRNPIELSNQLLHCEVPGRLNSLTVGKPFIPGLYSALRWNCAAAGGSPPLIITKELPGLSKAGKLVDLRIPRGSDPAVPHRDPPWPTLA